MMRMDYKEFKENFVEELKQSLFERGFENVSVKTDQVNKLNKSYEAVTITPDGSQIGVNTNLENFFCSYKSGIDYHNVVTKAADMEARGFDDMPQIEVSALTDYEQMKGKLEKAVLLKTLCYYYHGQSREKLKSSKNCTAEHSL